MSKRKRNHFYNPEERSPIGAVLITVKDCCRKGLFFLVGGESSRKSLLSKAPFVGESAFSKTFLASSIFCLLIELGNSESSLSRWRRGVVNCDSSQTPFSKGVNWGPLSCKTRSALLTEVSVIRGVADSSPTVTMGL